MSSAIFYKHLKETGIDTLWHADDPDCAPGTTVIVEYGSVLEFYDSSGYHARASPRAQAKDCVTPYANAFSAILSLIDELQEVPAQH